MDFDTHRTRANHVAKCQGIGDGLHTGATTHAGVICQICAIQIEAPTLSGI